MHKSRDIIVINTVTLTWLSRRTGATVIFALFSFPYSAKDTFESKKELKRDDYQLFGEVLKQHLIYRSWRLKFKVLDLKSEPVL